MRKLSFLFLLFLLTNQVSAYTLVLKSGKRVQGVLVSETVSHLILRDSSGVDLHYQKRTVDVDATNAANSTQETRNVEPPKSAVHPARVYTIEDLNRMPELSVVTADKSAYEQPPNEAQPDEAKWRKASAVLLRKKTKLEDRWHSAKQKCEQAKEKLIVPLKRNSITFVDPLEQPEACMKSDELRLELQRALEEWDDFTAEARKQGVPWSWLE